ncbi:GNAT family N-acetyltransferase [Plantactinospora siamensis]|uniref:GNAT family N-acetyltransferase n=1 Tax=Plantactinospora siamensis TaxID=555372 RepID=A0ABV6P5F7_9ACTN
MTPPIVAASPGEARAIADLIASAFADLPQTAWLVPDEHQRPHVLAGNVLIFVDHALQYGSVDLFDDRSGAAVWFDRSTPLPPPYRYQHRLEAVCAPYSSRFRALDELFDTHHPDGPHHHLTFLAVRPGRQRQGLGTALLNHHHRLLDQTGMPAYLEASSTSSRDLYTRHGYQPHGEPFCIPGCPEPFWPMWRPPNQPATPASAETAPDTRPSTPTEARTS